jgi:hypothetical protein
MSNGPPPACPADAVNAQWQFPQERVPPSPFEGCSGNGSSRDRALLMSNGSRPALRSRRLTAALAALAALAEH